MVDIGGVNPLRGSTPCLLKDPLIDAVISHDLRKKHSKSLLGANIWYFLGGACAEKLHFFAEIFDKVPKNAFFYKYVYGSENMSK